MTLASAFLGGLMIGAAALLLYAVSGRIAGISGIAFGSLFGALGERTWRVWFLAGLVAGGWAVVLTGFPKPLAQLGPGQFGAGLTIAAGLLVGFGTRMGNGCTSGHGVCGLARLSRRSLASVLLFMGVGIFTASLLRPWLAGVVQ